MPSLRDHYSKLQSVDSVGLNLPLPKHSKPIPTPALAAPAPTVLLQSQTADEDTLEAIVQPEPFESTASNSRAELMTRGLSAVFDPSLQGAGKSVKLPKLSLSEAFEMWKKRCPQGSLKDFLLSKLPADFPTVESRVARQRGFLGTSFFPTYLFGQEPEKGSGLQTTWLSAKKKANNKTSNYPVHAKQNGQDIKIGKLRSNFVGSQFVLYSEGANPDKAGADDVVRKELLALTYEATKKKGPREMKAAIPLETPKVPGKFLLDASEMDDTVQHLMNRKPRWNDHIKAFVLNFSKRVHEASVKNFQLVDKNDDTTLQFGKVSKDDFSLDFKYPFSPVEAFAVALSAFDFKWCCE